MVETESSHRCQRPVPGPRSFECRTYHNEFVLYISLPNQVREPKYNDPFFFLSFV